MTFRRIDYSIAKIRVPREGRLTLIGVSVPLLNCHPERLLHSHVTAPMEWVLQIVQKEVNASAKDLLNLSGMKISSW